MLFQKHKVLIGQGPILVALKRVGYVKKYKDPKPTKMDRIGRKL